MLSNLNPFKMNRRAEKEEEKAGEVGNPSLFPMFQDLPDGCQLLVLAFVASAPLERILNVVDDDRDALGTLTGSLPRVCRKFRDFCQSESLWQACLERALTSDKIWREAVVRMAPQLVSSATPYPDIAALRKHANVSSFKNLYQVVLNEHIRIRLPVFFMPCEFDPQNPRYQIHFFEPRYRIMMAELMRAPLQEHESRDGPVFLHVVDIRGPRAKAAALVKVNHASFAHDGRCFAELEFVSSVKLRRCWERPQSMGLYFGDGYRCDGIPLAEPMPHHWSYRVFS